ncbi:hypothetical protein B0H17DRAFT_1076962, partial [Mycena rosella]
MGSRGALRKRGAKDGMGRGRGRRWRRGKDEDGHGTEMGTRGRSGGAEEEVRCDRTGGSGGDWKGRQSDRGARRPRSEVGATWMGTCRGAGTGGKTTQTHGAGARAERSTARRHRTVVRCRAASRGPCAWPGSDSRHRRG